MENWHEMTQTLHRIRLQPYVPEQRIPDVTVRANEYRQDPDVRVLHNEWYAVSWELDFGKQTDERETSDFANNNQQTVTQEMLDTNNEKAMQKETVNQSGDTNDVKSSSSDFANLTTDVGNNPYIHRPHQLKVHLFPKNHSLQSLDIIQGKQQSITCDLVLSLMLILTSEDLTL